MTPPVNAVEDTDQPQPNVGAPKLPDQDELFEQGFILRRDPPTLQPIFEKPTEADHWVMLKRNELSVAFNACPNREPFGGKRYLVMPIDPDLLGDELRDLQELFERTQKDKEIHYPKRGATRLAIKAVRDRIIRAGRVVNPVSLHTVALAMASAESAFKNWNNEDQIMWGKAAKAGLAAIGVPFHDDMGLEMLGEQSKLLADMCVKTLSERYKVAPEVLDKDGKLSLALQRAFALYKSHRAEGVDITA